jgi:hypothetical protein
MAGSALGAFWSAVVSGPYGGDRSITWVGGRAVFSGLLIPRPRVRRVLAEYECPDTDYRGRWPSRWSRPRAKVRPGWLPRWSTGGLAGWWQSWHDPSSGVGVPHNRVVVSWACCRAAWPPVSYLLPVMGKDYRGGFGLRGSFGASQYPVLTAEPESTAVNGESLRFT